VVRFVNRKLRKSCVGTSLAVAVAVAVAVEKRRIEWDHAQGWQR
jgi:hypothetical protein